MQILKQDVKFGIGVYLVVTNIHFYVQMELFLIRFFFLLPHHPNQKINYFYVFQAYRVCDWWSNVHCPSSELLYSNNEELYRDSAGNLIWNEGGGSGTTDNPQAIIETTSNLYFGDRTEESRVHVIKTKKKYDQNKKNFINSDSKEFLLRESLNSLKNTTTISSINKSWKNSKNSSRGSVRYHRSKLSSNNQIKLDSKDIGKNQKRKYIDNKYNIDYDSSDDGKFEIFQTIEWYFYLIIFFFYLLL